MRYMALLISWVLICVTIPPVVSGQYSARPIISSISPTSGAPGTKVTINGQHFSKEDTLEFGGIPIEPDSISPTQIIAPIPEGVVQGRFTIKGKFTITSPQVFWVVLPKKKPVVSHVTPPMGPPGTVITIKGEHFSPASHENTVTIGGQHLTVRASSSTHITAVITHAATSGPIKVRVYNGGETLSKSHFQVLANLSLDSFTPQFGPPGSEVTLTGTGFSPKKKNNTVKLGDSLCKILNVTDTQLTVRIPLKGAQTNRFTVSVTGLGQTTTHAKFPVVIPPFIRDITPLNGKIGDEVVITGDHFGTDLESIQVHMGESVCPILSHSPTKIKIRVPNDAQTNHLQVAIPNAVAAKSKSPFEIWAPLAVSEFTPKEGIPGTQVTVTGGGFRTQPSLHTIYLGDIKVKVDSVEGNTLQFTIPSSMSDGLHQMKLEVQDRGHFLPMETFRVFHAPVLSHVTPSRAPAGSEVVIRGEYLGQNTNQSRILLGDTPLPIVSISPNQIRANIPYNVPIGKNFLRIQTRKRGLATYKKPLEVYTPVRIKNIQPSIATSDASILIFGSGFENTAKQNTVTLNGTKLKVLEASPNRLKVKLKKKSKTGNITVSVPSRGSHTSNEILEIVEQLKITGFSPVKGPVGTLVTITGSGFHPNHMKAYLGQTLVGLRVESPSKAIIRIPPFAATETLRFTSIGNAPVESPSPFTVTVPLFISGFSPATGPTGTSVSIFGAGFDPTSSKTTVTLNGTPLSIAKGSTNGILKVTIPPNATSGKFHVTVDGSVPQTSSFEFVVAQQTASDNSSVRSPTLAKTNASETTVPTSIQSTPAEKQRSPSTETHSQTDTADIDAYLKPKTQIQFPAITGFEPQTARAGEFIMVEGKHFGEAINDVAVWVGLQKVTVLDVLPEMIQIELPPNIKSGVIKIKIGNRPMTKSRKVLKILSD